MQTALTSIDSYKLGHAEMYPPNTTKVYSNFTPRSLTHLKAPKSFEDNRIVWFGLQGFLCEMHDIWENTFFSKRKDVVANDFGKFVAPFCGPNGFNLDRIKQLHDLGYLPISVKALREGSLVPVGVPVLTITNTHPDFYWLPNFLETWMSAELWKSSTSATIARTYRKIIEYWARRTGGDTDFIAYQAHDFSPRGMSGIADAAKSGAGHLLSFLGTDNLPAVQYLDTCYGGLETFVGCSVPASEHSVMCSEDIEAELDTYRYILSKYQSGVVSIVSDTYDFFRVVTEYATILKDEIMGRKPDAYGLSKVVFRPDSGDPVKIICGNPEAPQGSPENLGAVECLWNVFGGTTNSVGYRTLDSHVGLIYGDSITTERCNEILRLLSEKKFASDNIVFGVGSYTYQYVTRDTLGFAMKATYRMTDGQHVQIFKDPKTDNGTKRSAKGLIQVLKNADGYYMKDQVSWEEEGNSELKIVYIDGRLEGDIQSIAKIRKYLEEQE